MDRGRAGAVIASLAARQHGVVGRWQLLASGVSADAIDRRVTTGLLHPLHRGVYAVGNPAPDRLGRSMGAALAGGAEAALSHDAAGGLLGLLSYSGRPHVTIAGWRPNGQGIIWHSSLLPADEVGRHQDIPVTTPARTLLDLASTLDKHRLARAIDRAEALRLTSPTFLSALIERYPGRRGIAKLREIVDEGQVGLRITKSDLEDLFLVFADRYGLPRPETNVWMELGGRMIEADCLWRDARLIVELDSRGFHDTTQAFEADRARDRAAVAGGWRVVRVTYRQLTREHAALAADLHVAVRAGPARIQR